jgi:predicted hydrocarbon binding protein
VEERAVPVNAIRRNVSWIGAVENAIAENGDDMTARKIMKAAGEECACHILRECEAILGRRPENVDELLDATNERRRSMLKLDSLWEREGDRAHLRIEECGCTLVKAGLAKPSPVHCLCTAGMFESLFSLVCRGKVTVEVVRTIGSGDDTCEFNVYFEE